MTRQCPVHGLGWIYPTGGACICGELAREAAMEFVPYAMRVEDAARHSAGLQDAITEAARKLARREANEVDDAIQALLCAGVPLSEIEVCVYAHGTAERPEPFTVVRRRSQ